MKKLFLICVLALGASMTFAQTLTKEQIKAQKKEKKEKMALVKDAEKLLLTDSEGAIKTIQPAIESPLTNTNANVWYVVSKAKKNLIDAENFKRAKGEAFDAEKLYTSCYDIFSYLQKCDSLDKLPNEKGKVEAKYSEEISQLMYENRNHLYNGGSYYYNKEKFNEAFTQFDMFIKTIDFEPLKKYNLADDKKTNALAAYNTALCGMRTEDYNKVVKYINMAMQDSICAEQSCYFKAVAEKALGDTVNWISTLKLGVQKYPTNQFFYQNLIQYYESVNNESEIMKLADEMLVSDPKNPLFIFVKGYMAQEMKNIDEAMKWYNKTLEVDPNYENALANLALCYTMKAQEYNEKHATTNINNKAQLKKDKEVINGFFKQSLPIYEKLRELQPQNTSLWLTGLHNCYYNLGMNDKIKEIEYLLPKD